MLSKNKVEKIANQNILISDLSDDELDVDIEDRDVIDGSYYVNVVPDKGFFSKLLSTVSLTQTYQLVVKQLDESHSQVIFVDLSEENEQDTIEYSFDFFNELATKF